MLHQKAKGLPVKIVRLGSDSIDLLKRADLVISMAGYNTISEIMRYQKNAIIIPRPGPSAEQTMRTQLLADRGLFNYIHPYQLTASNLAELIMSRLENGTHMDEQKLPNLEGASAVARNMLSSI